ncbi:plasmid partitioning protein RepB [Rhizobium sp. FY34]|uniref:plasmid partitioning protein RepB n=1 Tax=Rhizobium sp. FY34 TaxID=2562309 RepID=UPI0010BF954A|nr:plasmid partitioning protein RepB [Rhizobium sp. FY34]
MMAGSRKNELKALFAGGLPPAAPSPAPTPAPERKDVAAVARSSSGAIKAMGLSLGSIAKDAEEVRVLRQALSEGERVISVLPEHIEASFVEDRLELADRDDEDFSALVDSIREGGQQVPVLLRPHPSKEGVYQTAYGHRRIRAAKRLGIAVKAVIRPLSDDELVLAQGKENAERRNLSFIERAIFARNLSQRGFDRKVIGEALSVQKSELSRLMQVVEAVPERYVRLIGAAPKAGRDRWMKLGELLQGKDLQLKADQVVSDRRFLASDSDQRFQLVFDRLSAVPEKPVALAEDLKDSAGRIFARMKRDGRTARIDFAANIDPAFLDEAMELLAERYELFLSSRKTG